MVRNGTSSWWVVGTLVASTRVNAMFCIGKGTPDMQWMLQSAESGAVRTSGGVQAALFGHLHAGPVVESAGAQGHVSNTQLCSPSQLSWSFASALSRGTGALQSVVPPAGALIVAPYVADEMDTAPKIHGHSTAME